MITKIPRMDANLHMSAALPSSTESLPHARKTPAVSKEAVQSCSSNNGEEVEKNPPTSSRKPRHPNGHKVKDLSELFPIMHKTKFLPLADNFMISDVWYQPSSVTSLDGGFLQVVFNEVPNGLNLSRTLQTYSVEAVDLLRMLYLTEMFNRDYYNMERETFEQWLNNCYAELLKSKPDLPYDEFGIIAESLMDKATFAVGTDTCFRVFFQKHCVRSFTGTDKDFPNLNLIKCKAGGKSQFEYVIEGRIFALPKGEEKK